MPTECKLTIIWDNTRISFLFGGDTDLNLHIQLQTLPKQFHIFTNSSTETIKSANVSPQLVVEVVYIKGSH